MGEKEEPWHARLAAGGCVTPRAPRSSHLRHLKEEHAVREAVVVVREVVRVSAAPRETDERVVIMTHHTYTHQVTSRRGDATGGVGTASPLG